MLDVGLQPTVFEARRNVGGVWAPREAGLAATQLDPAMKTNSSLFLTTFSDYFPYTSAPRTWRARNVGAYLRGFAALHLPPGTVRLRCRVTSLTAQGALWLVGFRDGQHDGQHDGQQQEGQHEGQHGGQHLGEHEGEPGQLPFDFVVVACGTFTDRFIPHADTLHNFKGKVVHSLDFACRDLLNASTDPRDEGEGGAKGEGGAEGERKHRILVVGGCLSGAEVPADVALHASSLPAEQRARVEILHLISRPFWAMPRFLPFANAADAQAPRVLPLDQVFFDAEALLAAPPAASPAEKFGRLATVLCAVMGSDQAELGPALHFAGHWRDELPAIGMSESYAAFVRAGAISPVLGRFAGVAADGRVRVAPPQTDPAAAPGPDRFLPAVDAIVFATGFTPWPALRSLFAPDVLRRIGVDPPPSADPPPHLLRERLYKQTIVPELAPERNLAFIGLLHRPFWGVLEVQARRLAATFAGRLPWPSAADVAAFRAGVGPLLACGRLSDALLLASDGGYIEILTDEGAALGLAPLADAVAAAAPHDFSPKPFISAHLPPAAAKAASCEHRARALDLLRRSMTAGSVAPANLAHAVFAGLHGRWRLSRTLRSALAGFPSGRFEGHAVFHPRLPTFLAMPPDPATAAATTTSAAVAATAATAAVATADGAGAAPESCGGRWTVAPPPVAPRNSLGSPVPEYLYSESGELTTTAGARLPASRKYIYQCDEISPADPDCTITAWFVKPDDTAGDAGEVDRFFHELDFSRAPEDLGTAEGVDGPGGLKAASEHLCDRDWYFPAYRFVFSAARLDRFWIRYRVLGPAKDYVSEALYVREA